MHQYDSVIMKYGVHLRRTLISTAFVVFAATLLLYGLTHVIPGDPIRGLFGFQPPPPELLAELRGRYGLDDPFYIQYLKFVRNSFQGELGYSIRGAAVSDLIGARLPVSARLVGLALAIQTVAGIAFGVVGTLRRNTVGGWLVRGSAIAVVAIPVFIVAFLLLGWVGYQSSWLQPRGLKGWGSYLLPAIAMAAVSTGLTIRMTHTELRETLRQPFIAFARSAGVRDRRIVSVHALKASLAPVVTLLAASASQMIGNLIIVEAIFELPGVGALVFDAIVTKDHNVIVGVLVIAVAFSIVSSTIADLILPRIDPRIRTTAL